MNLKKQICIQKNKSGPLGPLETERKSKSKYEIVRVTKVGASLFVAGAIFGGGLGSSHFSWQEQYLVKLSRHFPWQVAAHVLYIGNVFFPFRPARPGTTQSMESRFHSCITSKDTSDEGRATATRKNRQGACHSQGVSTGALVLMQIDVFSIFFKANLFLFDASALFGTWQGFQKLVEKSVSAKLTIFSLRVKLQVLRVTDTVHNLDYND